MSHSLKFELVQFFHESDPEAQDLDLKTISFDLLQNLPSKYHPARGHGENLAWFFHVRKYVR